MKNALLPQPGCVSALSKLLSDGNLPPMAINRHCHKCGREYTLAGTAGRSESCICGADLHCCLNCVSYDPRAAEQCRDRRAELVHDKAAANFCEWFEFARREYNPGGGNAREDAARDKLKSLFGD